MAVYRKLLPVEMPLYEAHLLRLTREDRRARFCGAASDGVVSRHVARFDWSRGLVLGAFVRGVPVGAAELRLDPGWPGRGEVAVSVEAAHQGQGVGAELVRRVLTLARNRAIGDVALHCLATNGRMRAIVRRLGGAVAAEAGEAEGRIRLPWPDQFSLLREAVEEGAGLVGAALDRLRAA
jgi:GNAT superfamily N-acetyltransferase